MRKIIIFLSFAFLKFLIFPLPVFASTDNVPTVLEVSPISGSSLINQTVVFKSSYYHLQGVEKIKEAYIWFDKTWPLSRRTYSSAHGMVKKVNNQWQYYGARYTGGTLQCGKDPEPKHCYKNYAWDVGGFSVGGNNLVYFNHDEAIADTTQSTPNSIGSFRAKSVRVVNSYTLEVEWEFTFGPFFKERELGIYLATTDISELTLQSENFPLWHQAGIWQVENQANQIIFKDDFEESSLPGWGKFGSYGRVISDNTHAYLGRFSAGIYADASRNGWQILERDLGEDKEGRVTVWFWDDMKSDSNFFLAVSDKSYDKTNKRYPSGTHWVGLAVRGSQNYHYRARLEDFEGNLLDHDENYYFDTGIKRKLGWHKVVFWITEKGAWAEIDDFEKEIFPYNLSSMGARVNKEARKKILPSDWEMTKFRYLSFFSKGGSFWVDNVLIEGSLPQPPNINDLAGNQQWTLHWAQIFLDSYEEIGMWTNLSNWSVSGAGVWWWINLGDLAHIHYFRYKLLGLPFDAAQANKILRFLLDNKDKWDDSGNFSFASVAGYHFYTRMAEMGWGYMPLDLKIRLWEGTAHYFDKLASSSRFFGNTYIGDSSGENYAWGFLYGALQASVFYPWYYQASEWQKISREMAMKSLSDNPNENCEVCPGGKVGVQTIYAPGIDVKDCLNNKDPSRSQKCLCRGDRSKLPLNHDFSYILDNHDYHPHPEYALGTMGGLTGAIHFLKVVGVGNIPQEYYHNLANVWNRHRDFIDYRRGIFKGEEIYRLRNKILCDVDYNNGEKDEPYNQVDDNPFRLSGLSDWEKQPSVTLVTYQNLKEALGEEAINNVQELNLLDHAKKSQYWRRFDYIGKPVTVGVYFTNSDLSCGNPCRYSFDSQVYIANRHNPAYQYLLHPAANIFGKTPLKVCEENIFKKKIWAGSLNWNCEEQIKKEGNNSLMLESSEFSDAELYSPLILVKPNTTYKVSYWVKTENLQPNAAVYGKIITSQYNQSAKEEEEVIQNIIDAGANLGENIGGTQDWIKKSYTFRTKSETKFVRLRAPMGLGGKAKGKVWFDEVKIEEINLIGDFNGDGQVNGQDIKVLLLSYLTNDLQKDLNSDGKVEILDFGKIMANL